MAPEKKIREGMITNMTTRQKVIAGVLVLVLLLVIWQVFALFGGEKTIEVTPKSTKQMTAAAPAASQAAATPQTAAGAPLPPPQVMTPPAPPPQPVVRESAEAQMLELQKKNEEKYIDALNQLQMLKLQREIAETNQGIASAKLATVTAEKNVSDLLTKPVGSVPQFPVGAYANSLVAPVPSGTTVETAAPLPPIPETTAPVEAPYSVISVSMQMGKWTAVLGFQGKLYNVAIGDVLPVDGSVVVGINKNGVFLFKDGKRRKVSIVSSI